MLDNIDVHGGAGGVTYHEMHFHHLTLNADKIVPGVQTQDLVGRAVIIKYDDIPPTHGFIHAVFAETGDHGIVPVGQPDQGAVQVDAGKMEYTVFVTAIVSGGSVQIVGRGST